MMSFSPGDVCNEFGDILMADGSALCVGCVIVRNNQAVRASRFGWTVVNDKVMPGYMAIGRRVRQVMDENVIPLEDWRAKPMLELCDVCSKMLSDFGRNNCAIEHCPHNIEKRVHDAVREKRRQNRAIAVTVFVLVVVYLAVMLGVSVSESVFRR